MKKARTILLFSLVICLGFASGWYLKPDGGKETEIWTPDLIRLYTEGKQVNITKTYDSQDFNPSPGLEEDQVEIKKTTDPQFFNLIQNMIVFELGDMISGGEDVIASAEDITEMKEYAVEYNYIKPKSVKINNGEDNIEIATFDSILFPIEEKWKGAVYLRTTDLRYFYCTSRPSLEHILDHT